MLQNLDNQLLFFINHRFINESFDHFAIFLANDYEWLLLLVPVFLWGVLRRDPNWRKAALLLLVIVVLCDLLCGQVLKPLIARDRACVTHAPGLRLPNQCGGRLGFPSNHAANGMALTTGMLGLGHPFAAFIFLIMALITGFSRVYLGAHYPSDILAGYLIGGFLGWLLTRQITMRVSFFRRKS